MPARQERERERATIQNAGKLFELCVYTLHVCGIANGVVLVLL